MHMRAIKDQWPMGTSIVFKIIMAFTQSEGEGANYPM